MDKNDETSESVPERSGHWLDTLGVAALAALSAGVFVLSVAAIVLVNQVGSALTGDAVVANADATHEIAFEPPAPSITVLPPRVDLPAWLANAQPFEAPPRMPVMAVVVLDDGTNASLIVEALKWTAPLSFAVAADFDASPHRVQQIRQAGREVLALVPFGYAPDFGRDPNVLRRGLSEAELLRRLRWHLARAGDGIVGVVDHHAGEIVQDEHALRIIGNGLVSDGMALIDSRSAPDTLFAARLRPMGVPVGRGTTRIGRDDSIGDALAALIDAERQAFAWGTAIVVVEASDTAMLALTEWLGTRRTSITLAPVSHVIRRLRAGLQQGVN